MKKTVNIKIDCAVCAQKCQDAICKLNGVNACNINFITQKMSLDIQDEDSEKIMKNIKKAARKVEPDFEMED